MIHCVLTTFDIIKIKAQVIRDGEQIMVDSEDLVPGDLAVLDEGDAVPADIRLIDVAQLELVESILTGESLPVLKKTDAIKAKVSCFPLFFYPCVIKLYLMS